MTYEEISEKKKKYTYALLYKYSQVKLCKVDDVAEDDWEECMEARFFSTAGELHIFPKENREYVISDKENGKYSNVYYDLHNNYKDLGEKVVVRRYLETDEDGQTYISRTRLFDIQ